MRVHAQAGFRPARLALLATVSAAALGALASPAAAQQSTAQGQPVPAPEGDEIGTQDAQPDSEILVTGFRNSLQAAINVKRDAVTFVDAIIAEDIAKFPDQNLAESLQRIPGVAIERDGGEGRRISVRGLGAQFTRVRLNGLETVAGEGGNSSRSFDFNVFASELFSSLVVHKSAEAALDEGSLGAVVDLNTGNPLAGRTGLTAAATVQGAYNSNSEQVKPRMAGLLSWKSPSGTVGASLSAAYSKTLTIEYGHDSGRWAQAPFDSVDGVPCWTTQNRGGSYIPGAACDAAALAFHARIPRYVEGRRSRERLGITGSVQFAPTDATTISLDGLYSTFEEFNQFRAGEVLFRGNERAIDLSDYTIDANNTLIRGTFDDAWVRNEHFQRNSKTTFHQFSAKWEQDLGESLRFTLLGGFSGSEADRPNATAIMLDDRDAQGFVYDYTDPQDAIIRFGTDAADPANFQISELRDSIDNIENTFRTLSLKAEWDVTDGLRLSGGGFYRRFAFDSVAAERNTVVCPSRPVAGPDAVLGTITCSPSTAFGPGAVFGYPATDALVELFDLSGTAMPQGSTTQFVVADLEAAADYTGLFGLPARPTVGSIRGVTEETSGGFLQLNFDSEVAGLRYAANAGIRYARTDQTSRGIISGAERVVERDYDDWLPSANLALFVTDDIIIRAAIAKVITRPELGDLTPGGSVDGFNYNISFGNPELEPYRATNYDLAAEWYFRPQSLLSVAAFRKDVTGFPIRQTTTGTYASTGLPLSLISPSSPAATNPEGAPWAISSVVNGSSAKLQGVELALQTPFWFLPGILSSFGVIANATFISSDADYEVAGPATVVAPNGQLTPIPQQVSGEFIGLSKRSYNTTLYYEDDRFGARISAAYRSGYLDSPGSNSNVLEGSRSTLYLDASTSYDLTDWATLSLEAINLTNERRHTYSDEASGRIQTYTYFGRTITGGVRFRF